MSTGVAALMNFESATGGERLGAALGAAAIGLFTRVLAAMRLEVRGARKARVAAWETALQRPLSRVD